VNFSYSFAELGSAFSQPIELSSLQEPVLASWNTDAAKLLGWNSIPGQITALLKGQIPLERSPVASLYAGHQFGVWVSQLGDGRAAILGEIENEGALWELQLKGSGPTPYSRGGDGRAVLRSSIREYLCSEVMHGLGIPTTRALCLIDSKTPVYREEVESGALIVRMAPTHIRFGSFEVFASRGQTDEVRQLADYVIQRYYPECLNNANPYLAFYQKVVERTAEMIAGWMAQGFSHGVMNTDNMSILGLTIDYGPFGFMENYNPEYICNHSDQTGRYAFNQQPNVASWNLGALGNALLSLLETKEAQSVLDGFKDLYLNAYKCRMSAKLGLEKVTETSERLVEDLLHLMRDCQADYSRSFRLLSRESTWEQAAQMFGDSKMFKVWLLRLDECRSTQADCEYLALGQNPKYLLRNYMAQIAIEKAQQGDYSEIDRQLHLMLKPYDEHPENEEYFAEPPDWAKRLSLSCSS
jgi:serine/tyrosine/threonine adenylyltransferase